MRKQAKNYFENDFLKVMNNNAFGKAMENVGKRVNIHATTFHDNSIKWFSKLNFKGCNGSNY